MQGFVRRRGSRLRIVAIALLAFAACATDTTTSASPRSSPTRTVPESTPTSDERVVRFAVIGDFGTGEGAENEVAGAVRTWMQESDADALVTTGDNVYPDGNPARFDAAWREPYGWVETSGATVVASLGNHDVLTSGGTEVMELLGMSAPWYSRKLGPVRLFVLDANRPDDPDQLAWLQRALTRSQAPWEIAVFHQPVYSCAIHRNTSRVQAWFLPVLKEQRVDLVLNGHDHNYQRFGSETGNTYVVTGGGGARLYRMHECLPGTPAPGVSDVEHHHFVTVEADSDSLHLQAIATDGTVIDDVDLMDPR